MIELAIITSASVRGTEAALSEWPANTLGPVPAVDLYCFMQDDVPKILLSALADEERESARTAIQVMSRLCDSPEGIAAVAGHLLTLVAGKKLHIRSFATFMPEISSEIVGDRAMARKALLFLVRLAVELRCAARGGHTGAVHDVRTIEMVAGTCIRDLGLGSPDAAPAEPILQRRDRKDGIKLMLDELRQIAEEAKHAGISFAIELEPGPLYIINGVRAVEDLFAQVDADPLLQSVVGLNLDIAHFRLAGIKPGDCLPEDKSGKKGFANKIVHAHICRHLRGHLDDLPIREDKIEELMHDYEEWLKFLKEIFGGKYDVVGIQPLPRSHVLSIELEAVKHSEALVETASATVRLLACTAESSADHGMRVAH